MVAWVYSLQTAEYSLTLIDLYYHTSLIHPWREISCIMLDCMSSEVAMAIIYTSNMLPWQPLGAKYTHLWVPINQFFRRLSLNIRPFLRTTYGPLGLYH